MNKELFFVVCGNQEEFERYVRTKSTDSYDYRYVFARMTLMGHNNPHGCFYGSWRKREDVQEILMELIVRTTDGSNWKLKELLKEVSENC